MSRFKFLIFLIFLSFSLTFADEECGKVKVGTSFSIGGVYSRHGQWPWLAALHRGGKYQCGASIISKKHLLGAAHCAHKKIEAQPYPTQDFHALLGAFDLNKNETSALKVKFVDIFIHPDWILNINNLRYDADIAVYSMASEIEFTDLIQPICLPKPYAKIFDVDGTVVGYGLSETSQPHENLPKHVQIRSVEFEVCVFTGDNLARYASKRMFCAGERGKNPCTGDSGGPFMVEEGDHWVVNGIVSVGVHSECERNDFVLFTQVPKFLQWIRMVQSSYYLESSSNNFASNTKQNQQKCGSSKFRYKRTIGGDYSEPGQWPWLAALYRGGKYQCGASIISKRHLLGGAGCIHPKRRNQPYPASDFHALLGAIDLNDKNDPNSVIRKISEISIHPQWILNINNLRFDADIAVFLMASEIEFTNLIQPICLPKPYAKVFDVYGTVVGYGFSETSSPHENRPKHVQIKSVEYGVCIYKSDYFRKIGSLRMFCAGERGKNPCKGDSGSPFMVREDDHWSINGIVSAAVSGECEENDFVLFTQVPVFLEWIQDIITNKNT